ncbi:MAG: UDP-N-acetylmuramoyl-L-alanine--D-glutamate ligase [Rickettsiales bacterium]|nr:UDP-N-acetylmuramoyl-L-alanine--D-glutamate ligase [Rickettsiales bacterium]|tara:strand:- start:15508 stop:16821 length:1314 start_codon:yes stop_codon:yes gene_type:complete
MIPDSTLSKKYFLYGLGKSNRSCAQYFKENNIEYAVWDDQEDVRRQFRDEFPNSQFVDLNTHTFQKTDGIVVSPGIKTTFPKENRIIKNARQADAYVGCDVDLFLRSIANKTIIGVTGTNGKSTVVALIAHVLRQLGYKAIAGGNIGLPVFEMEASDIYVLELSSFQLELISQRALDCAVILNIRPDHLDHHGNFSAYCKAKFRIYDLGAEKCFRLYGEDAFPMALDSREKINMPGDFESLKTILFEELRKESQEIYLVGKNFENVFNVFLILNQKFNIECSDYVEALKTFSPLPYRQQIVKSFDNILFVNDSKATNCSAALAAIDSYENIYWLVGGIFKETLADLEIFKKSKDRIAKMYCYGQSAEIFDTFADQLKKPRERFETLAEAVSAAYKDSKIAGGGVILLSPCCSSFDQFKNFEDRGEKFNQIVYSLGKY